MNVSYHPGKNPKHKSAEKALDSRNFLDICNERNSAMPRRERLINQNQSSGNIFEIYQQLWFLGKDLKHACGQPTLMAGSKERCNFAVNGAHGTIYYRIEKTIDCPTDILHIPQQHIDGTVNNETTEWLDDVIIVCYGTAIAHTEAVQKTIERL